MMYIFARFLGVVLVAGCAAIVPASLAAQEPSDLSRLYGQGVNAYFAGRSSEAEAYLSQALALDSEDPRLYYFRALSLLRLGRADEARGDMMVGANIEAQRSQRFAVGRALERVQGGHRLILEQYRRQARSEAAAASGQIAPATTAPQRQPPAARRLQQASFNDEVALRRRIVIPLDRLLGPGAPQPLSTDELSQLTRQTIGSQPVPPQPTGAAVPPTTASEDPFRDDPSRTDAAETGATTPPAVESTGEEQPEAEELTETEATPESGAEMPDAEATPEDDDNPFDFE
jgi:hypothetical protein